MHRCLSMDVPRGVWQHSRRSVYTITSAIAIASAAGIVLSGPVEAQTKSRTSTTKPNGSSVSRASVLQDPALRTGTLPNGMKYYIRPNRNPANRATLFLSVNAGSLVEDEDQQGFAHYMEHMAFNGTVNFPGHKLIDFVERAGMRFGADLNAYTSFDETVYMLTIPTDKPGVLQQGLRILEDWAGGKILFDSSEVVAERGVVLGEWRSRLMDTVSENSMRQSLGAILGKNSPYLQRMPIGKPELLETANPTPIQRFYKDWYRPDLMAVVAVGDFNPDEIERTIKQRFGAIPKAIKPRPRVPGVKVTRAAGSETSASTHAAGDGAPAAISMFRGKVNPRIDLVWRPQEKIVDPERALKQQIIDEILFRSVRQTFGALKDSDPRPFYDAVIGRFGVNREASDLYSLILVADPDSLMMGLRAALSAVERVARNGLSDAELTEHKSVLLRQYESYANSTNEVPSKDLAKLYSEHYLTGKGVLVTPEQHYAAVQRILPTVTSQTLAEAAKFWRSTQNRTILVQEPEYAIARRFTREDVQRVLDSVLTAPLPPNPVTAIAKTGNGLLRAQPAPGTIVSETRHAKSDIYEWKLSNGAKVLFKSTPFNPDELIIHAHSLGGSSLLPDSLAFSPGRMVDALMSAAPGLGDLGNEELLKQLSTTIVRDFKVSLNYGDEQVALSGSPKELETLFQMLYLQFTAPKIDTNALKSWKKYGQQSLAMSMNDSVASVLSRGNPRLAPRSPNLMQMIDPAQALAVYRDRFGDAGDFTFTIVGAGDPKTIRQFVERYIASLPSLGRREREKPLDPKVRPWAGIDRQRVEHPRLHSKRAMTTFVFDGRFPSAPDQYLIERPHLSTVSSILSRRLREDLRERMSVTYGVGASQSVYRNPELHYRFNISMDAAPEKIDTASMVILWNIDSLRMHGASSVELEKDQAVQNRLLENSLHENRFWVNMIQNYDQLGISLDRIGEPMTRPMTSAEFQESVKRYLPKGSFIGRTYVPKKE